MNDETPLQSEIGVRYDLAMERYFTYKELAKKCGRNRQYKAGSDYAAKAYRMLQAANQLREAWVRAQA